MRILATTKISAPQIRVAIWANGRTLGMQRRAFYPVLNEDDQIIGFVVASVLTQSLTQIKNNIIRIFILIFGALLSLGTLLSGASVYSIRKILFGHDPEEFRRMFLEHTDVIDRLEEGLLAVDTKGNVTLINKSARQMLGLEKEESSQAEIDKLLSQNQEIRPSIKYKKH